MVRNYIGQRGQQLGHVCVCAHTLARMCMYVCACGFKHVLDILTDFNNVPISSDPDMFKKFLNTGETFKIYFKELNFMVHSEIVYILDLNFQSRSR